MLQDICIYATEDSHPSGGKFASARLRARVRVIGSPHPCGKRKPRFNRQDYCICAGGSPYSCIRKPSPVRHKMHTSIRKSVLVRQKNESVRKRAPVTSGDQEHQRPKEVLLRLSPHDTKPQHHLGVKNTSYIGSSCSILAGDGEKG